MPIPTTGSPRTPDIVVRQPTSSEMARVVHLFRNVRLRAGSRFIVAERTHPIARFVGAATWWADGAIGRFQLACQPGLAPAEATTGLIEAVLAAAREAGLETLQYADLLPDGSGWLNVLQAQGFERVRSERSFEIAYADAWRRVMQLHQKHGSRIPADWRAEPIRDLSPETALEVIGSHRLLPPAEIRAYWQKNSPIGFTLDLSCILFDGERPFGAFLARRMGEVFYVDVQVVQEPNPRLRSLGDLFMMYRMFMLHQDAQRAGRDVPIRWLRFRSGQTEHQQTANLALRMGGRELARVHVLARPLTG